MNSDASDMHDSTNINASTDNTIREAFNDLNRRATMIPTDGGPHKNRTPNFNDGPRRRPLVPAMAFAAVAAVAAGSIGLWQLQDDDPAVNVAAEAEEADTQDGVEDDGVASEPADTDGDGAQADSDEASGSDEPTEDNDATDDDGSTSEPSDNAATGDVNSGDRFRVDTERVAADTADPFLNVRLEPGVDGALVAKLPPGYRGLKATGQTEDVGGQTWVEMSLMNPVAFEGFDNPFEQPTGWLSDALVLPLADGIAVGSNEVVPCSGAIELTPATSDGEFHVAGLESGFVTPGCLRIVMTLAEGSAAFDWAASAGAYGLPDIGVIDTSFGAHIDIAATGSAWPGATDTADGAFIVRDGDEEQASPVCTRSCLDLRILRPVESVSTTMLPDLGVVVVDVEIDDTDSFDPDSPVQLTGEPQIEAGAVIVEGIARPFEATVGIEIVDEDGSPVTASYSGGSIGDIEGEQYGVDTTDWTEAWGLFNFRAEGLAPGDYTMLLDAEGGSDTPTLVEVPFTITE